MDRTSLRFKGAPGSPYTRKMLAYLRYRRLPYEFLLTDQADREGLPEPKVALLPTFYLPGRDGAVEAVVDSTPLIRRFEGEFSGRATLPPHPAIAFLNDLVEDYADEWLTKPMFHYRWYYDADIEQAGTVLPHWRAIQADRATLATLKAQFSKRQIDRLYVVGSNDITAPVIEASYQRLLAILDGLIEAQKFVFGGRPASADFALYAQLTQLARFDPTPAAVCLREAPRVFAWTDLVDDLSGHPAEENAWGDLATLETHLKPLLAEIGRTYAPVLLANADALQGGAAELETTIDGQRWVQPPFPYQGRCLQALRSAYGQLTSSDRAAVDRILAGTGCEPLFT
ncbi:MAG: glutathione S-transferase N-terminal domain-containing protein [Pseudomonadales bacterium]|nr:glutathione S-transferase N-terminal domain-containing protein [Pseudomonadales bacterium]